MAGGGSLAKNFINRFREELIWLIENEDTYERLRPFKELFQFYNVDNP